MMTSYRKVDVWLSDIILSFSGFWTCKSSCLVSRTWAGARVWTPDLPHFRRLFWELGFWLFGGGPLSVVLRRNFILGQKTLSQPLFHWIWHTLCEVVFWVSQYFPSKIHFVRKLATSFHPVLAAQIPCKEKTQLDRMFQLWELKSGRWHNWSFPFLPTDPSDQVLSFLCFPSQQPDLCFIWDDWEKRPLTAPTLG